MKDYKTLLSHLTGTESIFYFYLLTRCDDDNKITISNRPEDYPLLDALKEKGCIEYERTADSVTIKCLK